MCVPYNLAVETQLGSFILHACFSFFLLSVRTPIQTNLQPSSTALSPVQPSSGQCSQLAKALLQLASSSATSRDHHLLRAGARHYLPTVVGIYNQVSRIRARCTFDCRRYRQSTLNCNHPFASQKASYNLAYVNSVLVVP